MSEIFDEIIQKLADMQEESVKEAIKETYLAQSKRAELLQVATQLAAGYGYDRQQSEFAYVMNDEAINQAKDLIAKVDKECGE